MAGHSANPMSYMLNIYCVSVFGRHCDRPKRFVKALSVELMLEDLNIETILNKRPVGLG